MKRKVFSYCLAFIGFILSPASWWNDLLVNFPISYILALPFGLLNRSFFLPMFIVSYWLTNILGLVLMHYGVKGLIKKNNEVISKEEIKNMFIFALLYTGLIIILILTGVVTFPEEFLDKFIQLTNNV